MANVKYHLKTADPVSPVSESTGLELTMVTYCFSGVSFSIEDRVLRRATRKQDTNSSINLTHMIFISIRETIFAICSSVQGLSIGICILRPTPENTGFKKNSYTFFSKDSLHIKP